jgi:hypothetical protein
MPSPTDMQELLIERLRILVAVIEAAAPDLPWPAIDAYNATLNLLLDTGWDDALGEDALLRGDDLHDLPLIDLRYFEATWKPKGPPPSLLRAHLEAHDPLLLDVRKTGPQQYCGTIRRVYARRFAGGDGYAGPTIDFVGGTGAWGNRTLVDGERALVFVTRLRGRCYQEHWNGHLSIQDLGGTPCVIAPASLLGDGASGWWGPAELRAAAFRVPDSANQVALPFALVEQHLLAELESLGNPGGSGDRP